MCGADQDVVEAESLSDGAVRECGEVEHDAKFLRGDLYGRHRYPSESPVPVWAGWPVGCS